MILMIHLCDTVPVSEVCSVELVGSVAVNGNSATLVFRGVGSGITSFLCKVDGIIFPECEFNLAIYNNYTLMILRTL